MQSPFDHQRYPRDSRSPRPGTQSPNDRSFSRRPSMRLTRCALLFVELFSLRRIAFRAEVSSLARLALGQAEPVPRVVAKDRLDPIRPVRRLLQELDTLLRELVISPLAIVRLHRSRPELSSRDQCGDRFRGLVVDHWRARLREDDLEVGLILRADRQPAKVVHRGVSAYLEAKLFRVELLGRVLIEDPDRRVRDSFDHLVSPLRSLVADDTERAVARLLPDCALA